MPTKTLIFTALMLAALSVSAEQSVLESVGTHAAKNAAKEAGKDAARDILKSAVPADVTEGAETVEKANAVKKSAQNPTAGVQDKALEKKPAEAAPDASTTEKSTKETTSKAKPATDSLTDPSALMDKAVESGKTKAKKKAVDSALDMLH